MYFIKNNKTDIAERSAEVLQYAQQLETGKKYRYRIIRQTEGEQINFNIYRAEYDGEFIGEYKFITCTSAPVPENNIGSFLFYTYKGTDILIDNVLYRDIDKYGIKLIENGENVEIFNTHAISGDVTVVLAYYNGDKLVKAMPETINFGENEAKKELPIQTAITEEYDKIKVFVWDSLKSLKPLAQALIK